MALRKARKTKLPPIYRCECCGRFHNGTRYLTQQELEPYIELFKARRSVHADIDKGPPGRPTSRDA
jgi:hypothetical protein